MQPPSDAGEPALPEMATLQPVASLSCAFHDKFGLPRQPDPATEIRGTVTFLPGFDRPEMVRGLEGFSHLWLLGFFHRTPWTGATTVRPPRLGGNLRVGVWATRAPNRPNSLSLSLVRLLEISTGPLRLEVAGCDMVDGTPVLDIKPYLPWCESIPDARSGWATAPPALLEESSIKFPAPLAEVFGRCGDSRGEILAMLRGDPRPAYLAGKSAPERIFGATVAGWNVRWRRFEDRVEVVEFSRLPEGADP